MPNPLRILLILALAVFAGDAIAAPFEMICQPLGGNGSPFYFRLDKGLKLVALGPSDSSFSTFPISINGPDVSWTSVDSSGVTWNYNFDQSKGVLSYGPAGRMDLVAKEFCSRK